jgi:leader peptidase (prepilin peptidase)/N-methyltransferase
VTFFEILRLAFFILVMVELAVIDIKLGLLPNRVIYPSMVIALVLNIISPETETVLSLVTGVSLAAFFLVVMLLLKQLGAGDIKLALLIGLMAGFPGGIIALFSGIFLGGLVAIGLVVSRVRKREDTIPYGPFLAAGTVFALIGTQCHIFDFLYSLPVLV